METRKPLTYQQVKMIERVTPYERRRVTLFGPEDLIPFSDWQPTMDDAIEAVPAVWLLPRYAKLVVLQRCNLCGVWSYRYVINRALAS